MPEPVNEQKKESFFQRYKKKLFGNLFKKNKSINKETAERIGKERNRSVMSKVGFFKGLLLSLGLGGSKKTKTGRYGAKKRKKRNDVFTSMDLSEQPQNAFFNPFESIEASKDDPMQKDFLDRVDEQIDLNDANDFEREGRDLYYEEQIAQKVSEKIDKKRGELKTAIKEEPVLMQESDVANPDFGNISFDGTVNNKEIAEEAEKGVGPKEQGQAKVEEIADPTTMEESPEIDEADMQFDRPYKGFVPDFKKDADPTDFYFSVGVNKGDKHIDAMSREKISRKFSFMKLLSNLFSKKKETEDQKKAEWSSVADAAMKKSPVYKALVERGKSDAAKKKKSYNPDKDPRIDLLRSEFANTDLEATGHSMIALGGEKNGTPVIQYSFGFFPGAKVSLGQTVPGRVVNPDGNGSEKLSDAQSNRTYKISYENIINAAAKIRGVIGSGRSYTVSGYNCTTFALDVAEAAGVSFDQKDVTSKMMTTEATDHFVDTPNALGAFLDSQEDAELAKEDKEYDRNEADAFVRDIISVRDIGSGKNDAGVVYDILAGYKEKLLKLPAFRKKRCADESVDAEYAADRFFLAVQGFLNEFLEKNGQYRDENEEIDLEATSTDELKMISRYGMSKSERKFMSELKKKFTAMFGTSSIQEFLAESFTDEAGYLRAEGIIEARHEYDLANRFDEYSFWKDALESGGVSKLIADDNETYAKIKAQNANRAQRVQEVRANKANKAQEVAKNFVDFDETQKLDEGDTTFDISAAKAFSERVNKVLMDQNPGSSRIFSIRSEIFTAVSNILDNIGMPGKFVDKIKFWSSLDTEFIRIMFFIGLLTDMVKSDQKKALLDIIDGYERDRDPYAIDGVADDFRRPLRKLARTMDSAKIPADVVKALIKVTNTF